MYDWDAFDLTEHMIKEYPVWVGEFMHCVPAWTPLMAHLFLSGWQCAGAYASETVSWPRCKGFRQRAHKGYVYISSSVIKDEDEVKRREIAFREKLAPVLDDPWGHWARLRDEIKAFYDRILSVDVGQITTGELVGHFRTLVDYHRRMCEIHHLGMYPLWSTGGLLFPELCKELAGIEPSNPDYSRVLSGFDNTLFQLNKGLAELATAAVELKLEDKFKLSDEEVLQAVEQSDAGKQWINKLNEFLRIHGWRCVRMWDVCTPTWVEKPSLAVAEIRALMAVGGKYAPDLQRERMVQEREKIEKELLGKVPAEQREWFSKLLLCAQAGQWYSEDHAYWCELRFYALVRRATIELGKRLVKFGTLGDPEDIYYLSPYEITRIAVDENRAGTDIRQIVNRRREERDGYLAHPPISDELPLFIGDPATLPDTLTDVPLQVVFAERVAQPEEVGATCVGAVGAPGVVEGTARVIMSEEDLGQIQPGEILVAPLTAPSWTPAFGLIKAVVTDTGGIMAHAAIVGREYGIPAVVGCQDATMKIKTGDRIKVDGDLLRVYVLK